MSPDTNVAASNKDRLSPSYSHSQLSNLRGHAELCPSLPALEGCAAPAQGCSDVPSTSTEVEPNQSWEHHLGLLLPRSLPHSTPGAAEIATWSRAELQAASIILHE